MKCLRYSCIVSLLISSNFLIIGVKCIESSYFFYQHPEYPRDCKEVYAQCSSHNSSGVYTIKPDGYPNPFEVYCDNQISPGGWTVIQRQIDGSLKFQRTWEDYRNGFGFLSSEFYIGNDKLSYLTNQAEYELRIEMVLSNGSHFYIKYNKFRTGDAWSQYKLVHAEEFSGNSSCVATSCPIGMAHGDCSCQTNCRDTVGMTDCYEICEETCVPIGCFVNEANTFIMEGEHYSDPACTKMCSCSDGELRCDSNYKCDINAVCQNKSQYHQCYCNEGYSGNGNICRSICEENEVYGTCNCQISCANPERCDSCHGVKGCYCPSGFYLQGVDCVRQEQCNCFIDGFILPEGNSYSDSACTKRCSCNNGRLSCENDYRCDANAACEIRSTYHKCYCNEGYSGNGVTCESVCSSNEIYGTCNCQRSCTNPTGCVSCSRGRGCYCPNGFYLQGWNCVPQEQCSCYVDGRILTNGETYVNSDCSMRCTCNNNRLNCDRGYRCTSNAGCRVRSGVRQCYCNTGYVGDGVTSCTIPYTDCNDVRNAQQPSGVYYIRPAGWSGSPFNVYCNMTIDGGGWTVFQRRMDGSQDFFRYWSHYRNGFGSPNRELWLGNDKLHSLTSQGRYQLRIDFVNRYGASYYAKYSSFNVGNAGDKYRLSVGGYSGNAGNYMSGFDGRAFTTRDRDNDAWSRGNCATASYSPCGTSCRFNSGWWFDSCGYSLNAPYGTNCLYWYYLPGSRCNVKYTEMKIRRV